MSASETHHREKIAAGGERRAIAEGIVDEGIIYDCPWDDFLFMYFRGKDSETAARELGAWAQFQRIKVVV